MADGFMYSRSERHRMAAGWSWFPVLVCGADWQTLRFSRPHRSITVIDCAACFPSSDASLGAASTTLNPPPGENTGVQQ